jgi:hypothetical protein
MLRDFYQALIAYKRARDPKLPLLECCEPVTISTHELRPKGKWPSARRAGVYVVFSEEGKILHLGHTSLIGKSLVAEFFDDGYDGQTTDCKGQTPAQVVFLMVHRHPEIEAACLETFLRSQHPAMFESAFSTGVS